ncbi:hypothetical protein [Acinetobacter baumannii]
MANNNRVEVHVGAKTSELKEGMQDAEKIVSDSAKKIENTTKGVNFKCKHPANTALPSDPISLNLVPT